MRDVYQCSKCNKFMESDKMMVLHDPSWPNEIWVCESCFGKMQK